MAEKKVTKKEWYNTIKEIVSVSDSENKDAAIEFIDKQIEAIEQKAVKAAEAAAKKKADNDTLKDAVYAILTTDLQTIDEIVSQVVVEGIEVTKAKVTSRLTTLVKEEVAEKDMVKLEDKRKVVAYRLV